MISDLQRDGASVGEEIAAHLGSNPRSGDLVILLPDPHAFDPRSVLDGIREALGPAVVVGAVGRLGSDFCVFVYRYLY